MKLTAKTKTLDLSSPQIMGILNFTPDSFSDSGQFFQLDKALVQVETMLQQGASIIDIGGESTRPMAEEVTLEQELERVIPLVEAVRQRFDCWVSVDTSKALVMQEAANAGMDLINDVVADVLKFMQQRTEPCLASGIKKENLIWDPGFGFGKSVQHNYRLLQQLSVFCEQGYPVLAGISRKSMIGAVLDKTVEQRTVGSVVAALIAAIKGACILRVHDVGETADALKIWQATMNA